MKKLYFVEYGDYIVISVDENGNYRWMDETNDNTYLFDDVNNAESKEEKCKAAEAFLKAVEDDSSWKEIDPWNDETAKQQTEFLEDCISPNYFEIDHPEVMAEIETDLL